MAEKEREIFDVAHLILISQAWFGRKQMNATY